MGRPDTVDAVAPGGYPEEGSRETRPRL